MHEYIKLLALYITIPRDKYMSYYPLTHFSSSFLLHVR